MNSASEKERLSARRRRRRFLERQRRKLQESLIAKSLPVVADPGEFLLAVGEEAEFVWISGVLWNGEEPRKSNMNNVKAIVDFSGYAAADLAAPAQMIHDKMLANATTFPTPPVTMAALQTSITDYLAKLTARESGAKSDTVAFNVARNELESDLADNGGYVNTVAKESLVNVDLSGYLQHHERARLLAAGGADRRAPAPGRHERLPRRALQAGPRAEHERGGNLHRRPQRGGQLARGRHLQRRQSRDHRPHARLDRLGAHPHRRPAKRQGRLERPGEDHGGVIGGRLELRAAHEWSNFQSAYGRAVPVAAIYRPAAEPATAFCARTPWAKA